MFSFISIYYYLYRIYRIDILYRIHIHYRIDRVYRIYKIYRLYTMYRVNKTDRQIKIFIGCSDILFIDTLYEWTHKIVVFSTSRK